MNSAPMNGTSPRDAANKQDTAGHGRGAVAEADVRVQRS